MHYCVCIVCVHSHTSSYTAVSADARGQSQGHSSAALHPVFWDMHSHWPWESLIWLIQQAPRIQLSLHSQCWIASTRHHTQLLSGFWGFNSVSCACKANICSLNHLSSLCTLEVYKPGRKMLSVDWESWWGMRSRCRQPRFTIVHGLWPSAGYQDSLYFISLSVKWIQ